MSQLPPSSPAQIRHRQFTHAILLRAKHTLPQAGGAAYLGDCGTSLEAGGASARSNANAWSATRLAVRQWPTSPCPRAELLGRVSVAVTAGFMQTSRRFACRYIARGSSRAGSVASVNKQCQAVGRLPQMRDLVDVQLCSTCHRPSRHYRFHSIRKDLLRHDRASLFASSRTSQLSGLYLCLSSPAAWFKLGIT